MPSPWIAVMIVGMTREMKAKRLLWGVLGLLCAASVAGCRDSTTPPPKVVWKDETARFVLHRVVYPTWPDPTMSYRLVLSTTQGSREVTKGQTQVHSFAWLFHATRLPAGQVAWLLGDRLCQISTKGVPRCTTLPSMHCPFFSPPAPLAPDATLRAAYRWVGRLEGQYARQLAAADALERLGAEKSALEILQGLDDTQPQSAHLSLRRKGLELSITGERRLRYELERAFQRGGFCRRAAVLAACVPEMKDLLPRALKTARDRPRWIESFKRLHQHCTLRQQRR